VFDWGYLLYFGGYLLFFWVCDGVLLYFGFQVSWGVFLGGVGCLIGGIFCFFWVCDGVLLYFGFLVSWGVFLGGFGCLIGGIYCFLGVSFCFLGCVMGSYCILGYL
jgi:hypothetical protein